MSETVGDDAEDTPSEVIYLALPKSANLICQFSSKRILAGFKSLWTIS